MGSYFTISSTKWIEFPASNLLLVTCWYETPDGQKDTMRLAISLAQTIGLSRNPKISVIDPNRKKLWKRIWWSCLMRDCLVLLGMG